MSSQPVYRQLVLLDGTNNSTKLLANIRDLSKIPSNCDVWIFCNQENTTVQNSLNGLNNVSHIRVNVSSNPIKQMFNTLNANIFKCSLILIIGVDEEIRTFKWNNVREAQMNTCIVKMDSSSTTLSCVLNELRCKRNETREALTSIDFEFFPQHQCPLCSQSFHSNDILRIHCTDNHIPTTHDNAYPDYYADVQYSRTGNRNDLYKMELYCLVCDKNFQSLAHRNNHTREVHPNALANSFE